MNTASGQPSSLGAGEESLRSVYERACRRYYLLESRGTSDPAETTDLVALFMRCSAAVKQLALFSFSSAPSAVAASQQKRQSSRSLSYQDEDEDWGDPEDASAAESGDKRNSGRGIVDLDDIPTFSLQFIMLPFYVGSLLTKTSSIESIHSGIAHLQSFLREASRFHLLPSAEDASATGSALAPADPTRDRLRLKLRLDKQLRAMTEKFESYEAVDALKGVPEEDMRDFFILRCQSHVLDAEQLIRNAKQEVQLLEFADRRGLAPGGSSERDITQRQQFAKSRSERLAQAQPPLRIEREQLLRHQIFLDRNPASMSVEEWGAVEAERLWERQRAEKAQKDAEESRRGRLSEDEREEEDRQKQSRWDDWKDANPKGVGNSMR